MKNQWKNESIEIMSTIANPGIAIANGEIQGVSGSFVFGRSTVLGATESVVWDGGGEYKFLTSAEKLTVVSSSVDDIMTTGTGAWNVRLVGLDNNWDQIEEIIELDGTTPVETLASFLRLNHAQVIDSGTDSTVADANIGTITIAPKVTTASVQGIILPNVGSTKMATFSVPAGMNALITQTSFTVGSGRAVQFRGKSRVFGANSAFITNWAVDIFQAAFTCMFTNPFRFPEKSDLVVTGIASQANTTASASYCLQLFYN
jgi:hypothetical protein